MNHINTCASQTSTIVSPLVWLSVLASVLIAGCSSPPPPVTPVYRKPCLDDGPVNSAAYDTCVQDREFDKALAPTGPYPVELSAGKEPAWHAEELTGDNLHREIRITPKRCVE
ncbi:MAG: hypothetical protein WBH22_01720 [Pseudomonas mandelii]|uniref:hypothetical protein n=1 Tax=Pseudomonas mandelii TaxID=75612 RepID=UPI003C775E39